MDGRRQRQLRRRQLQYPLSDRLTQRKQKRQIRRREPRKAKNKNALINNSNKTFCRWRSATSSAKPADLFGEHKMSLNIFSINH